jgi:hypothetical protein
MMLPRALFVGNAIAVLITVSIKLGSNASISFVIYRWKIEYGKVWQHLSGELIGQTQVAYAHISEKESLPLSHPLDAHFAVAGLQVSYCITQSIFHCGFITSTR